MRHAGDRVPRGLRVRDGVDGETGFVVEDEHAMAEAIGRLDEIDPERCRESARERFDVAAVGGGLRESLRGGVEQPALGHELHRQRAVADRLEEHHHAVAVVALHHALAPVGVPHARADLERPRALPAPAAARLAVVAVAARRRAAAHRSS